MTLATDLYLIVFGHGRLRGFKSHLTVYLMVLLLKHVTIILDSGVQLNALIQVYLVTDV